MSTPHPAEVARQQARAALAALPPAARGFLEGLHAEYFPAALGGRAYTFEDLLGHLSDGDRYRFGDERLAQALAVPVAYLRAVREAVGLAAPREKEAERASAAMLSQGSQP
jgi:hypothetical protein